MADVYFNLEQAKTMMRNGAIMSVSSGKYDYYRIENGDIIGCYSCDHEDYIITNPPISGWYLISSEG